jgi:hypothetical protein
MNQQWVFKWLTINCMLSDIEREWQHYFHVNKSNALTLIMNDYAICAIYAFVSNNHWIVSCTTYCALINDISRWAPSNVRWANEQIKIFIIYIVPHHLIFQQYSFAMWLYFLWCGKRFIVDEKNILPHGQRSNFKTQTIFFWKYLFINMVVQKLYAYT